MSNTPYQDHMTDMFTVYDTDGDGRVEEDDFTSVAQRILSEFRHSPDSPAGRRVNKAAAALWVSLSSTVDADANGVLTKDEFLQAAHRGLFGGVGPVAESAHEWADSIVAAADTDHDNALTREEFVRLMRAFGSPEGGITLIIDHMSGNGEAISTDKVRTAFRNAYTTDVPVQAIPALAG